MIVAAAEWLGILRFLHADESAAAVLNGARCPGCASVVGASVEAGRIANDAPVRSLVVHHHNHLQKVNNFNYLITKKTNASWILTLELSKYK